MAAGLVRVSRLRARPLRARHIRRAGCRATRSRTRVAARGWRTTASARSTSSATGPVAGRRPMTGRERGQASVEFVALLLLACLALGALFALSGWLRRARCRRLPGAPLRLRGQRGAATRDERLLAAAYGARDAATVRALAPNLVYERGERELPVDWRPCRRVSCSLAPDDARLDAHLGAAPAAARHRLHPRAPPRRPALRPVLALLPRLQHDAGRVGRAVGALVAASAPEAAGAGHVRLPRLSPGRLGGRLRPRRSRRERLATGQLARPLPGLQMGGLPWRVGARTPAGCGSRAAAIPDTCRSAASRAGARRARAPSAPRYMPRPARAAPHSAAAGPTASASAAPPARAFGSSRSSRSTRGCTRRSTPVSSLRGTRTPTATRRRDTREGQIGSCGLGWNTWIRAGPRLLRQASRGSAISVKVGLCSAREACSGARGSSAG